MIIDSHVHYSHVRFMEEFPYLDLNESGYCVSRGSREELFDALRRPGIRCVIEPGISLQSNEAVLELNRQYPGMVFPAIGVHPTRTFQAKWSQRSRLKPLAETSNVVAIGETGLDYHYKRPEQHRFVQHLWFFYQLELARKKRLPLILHIRDAHRDAVRVLKLYRKKLCGGVVHCFGGGPQEAQDYLELGYHIGIGGALLQNAERTAKLREAVAHTIPLDRILIETDSPYVLPDCRGILSSKQQKKVRNTSLILPEVIRTIGELKGISSEEVARVTAENAVRLFSLPIDLQAAGESRSLR